MKKVFICFLVLVIMAAGTAGFAKQVDYREYSQWPVSEEKIPFDLYLFRSDAYGCDAKDMYFWNYFNEYSGLEANIEQISESAIAERVSLMFASGDVPDVVYGIPISTDNIVQYGAEEGLLLDMSPYNNEDVMPNLCQIIKDMPQVLSYCTCTDGKVYTLPSIGVTKDGESTRSFIDYALLQSLGLEIPTTLDEFVDAMYAIKEKYPDMIPLGGSQDAYNPSYYILNALGYLGTAYNDGSAVTVRENKAVIPASDETYKVFLKLMNQFYNDGIISKDFYTIDSITVNAQMAEGKLGVYPFVPYTVTPAYEDFSHWESLIPLTSEYNETAKWLAHNQVNVGYFVMSADCEHPEEILRAFDAYYTMQMTLYTWYGPMYEEGVGGMYIDENCTKHFLRPDGTEYEAGLEYCYQYGSGANCAMGVVNMGDGFNVECPNKMAAIQYVMAELWDNDGSALKFYDDQLGDGIFRNSMATNITPYESQGYPNVVYMSADDSYRLSELESVLVPFMKAETAKFITGARSLDEIDAYLEECRELGSDELNGLYDKYYQIYLENTED